MIARSTFIMIFILVSGLTILHAQDPLLPDAQLVIELNDTTPKTGYTFAAEADSVWSFSAVRIEGDLDPVLRIYDEDNSLLLANDNENRRSQNARLENWVVPATGEYTLEVAREGDERARTSGRLVLTALTDANSVILSRLPITEEASLEAGDVLDLASTINPDQAPIQITFGVDFETGDLFGLQLRGRDPQGIGDWLLVMGSDGATLQRTQLDPEADETNATFEAVIVDDTTPLTTGQYTILLENRRLEIRVDGESILVIEDLPQNVNLLQGINLRLIALPDNANPIIFQQIYASAPFYPDGDSSVAMPPIQPDQHLYSYSEIPLHVINELRELGYIPTGGGLAFTVPDAIIETSAAGFSTFPLEMAMGFQDFVLHFSAVVRVGSESAACGMNIRQVNNANFVGVLFSADGNAYILPYTDGTLEADNLAINSNWINTGLGAENHVTLIAQDNEAILFMNGVLVGTLPLEAVSGGLQMTMVVNDPVVTRCTYGNIWVWGLDE